MSTRSTIWIQNETGFTGAYCHNDGYLENNGAILLNNYNSLDKVLELISNGSISSLSYFVGDKCNFDYSLRTAREANNCCFYHRDRGEPLEIFNVNNLNEASGFFEDYNYFFINNQWHYYSDDKMILLTDKEILQHWAGNGYIEPFFAQKVLKDLLFKEDKDV